MAAEDTKGTAGRSGGRPRAAGTGSGTASRAASRAASGTWTGDDEPLVFREHWRVLVRPVAVLFLVVGAAAFLASMAPDREGRVWARLAVLVVALGAVVRWTAVPWLRWLTDRHVVQSGRLVVRSGLMTQEGRALALARIRDVTFTQDSLLERLLGIGTLVVTPDDGREPMELVGVGRVEEAQAQLLRLVDRARAAAYHATYQATRKATYDADRDAAG